MRNECENLLLEFEAYDDGRPVPPDLMERLKEHARGCADCLEVILAKCGTRIIEESGEEPPAWDSEAVWHSILDAREELGTGEEQGECDVILRRQRQGRTPRRLASLALGMLGIAAILTIVLWPAAPTGHLVSQAWSAGGITRTAPDPDIFSGSEPIELSAVIKGEASDRWLMGIVLMRKAELASVRLGMDANGSIEVDGEYEVDLQPIVIYPANLPTHLILLFTEHQITAADWKRDGPDAARSDQAPADVARDIAERFNGRTVLLPLGSNQ